MAHINHALMQQVFDVPLLLLEADFQQRRLEGLSLGAEQRVTASRSHRSESPCKENSIKPNDTSDLSAMLETITLQSVACLWFSKLGGYEK